MSFPYGTEVSNPPPGGPAGSSAKGARAPPWSWWRSRSCCPSRSSGWRSA